MSWSKIMILSRSDIKSKRIEISATLYMFHGDMAWSTFIQIKSKYAT
jgi:hypothetical protein